MSDSNENEDLLRELEEVTSQLPSCESKDTSVLDNDTASVVVDSSMQADEVENVAEEPVEMDTENAQKQSSLQEESSAIVDEAECVQESNVMLTDATLDPSSVVSNQNLDPSEKISNSTNSKILLVEPDEIEKDAPLLESPKVMAVATSPNVPEIVPNSETHISNLNESNEENYTEIETETMSESNEDNGGLVKEEMLDDVVETSEHNTSFNVSPSFEANLDPKFKPTIRLQKINLNTGQIKHETEEGKLSDEETNLNEDENSTMRPRRSIKTPAHLADGFVLGTKDANSKPEKATPTKLVPIKPKPLDTNKEAVKGKNPVITIKKTPVKATVGKPASNKQKGNREEAKEIIRKLNADSVPSILKRGKKKVDESEGGEAEVDLKAAPARKEKVGPPKKKARRHRKVFDYESYLRDHLEAEVNDKKPRNATGSGTAHQLLSSLVGVNIPPSKIKVLPFNNSPVNTTLRRSNENESSNREPTNQRTLYNLMEDMSKMLPSWNLHVMPDSNTFCIAQVCRSRSGIPTLKTTIELDPQFNAKVFIHQLHCKRYDGVYDSEESISALIQEIDAFSK